MAKRPSISSVGSGYTSPETLNQNFQNIAEAFDNTLSRDGSTPNSMKADLDLDGNDILNVDNLNVTGTINYQGRVLTPGGGGEGSGVAVLYNSTLLTPVATALNFTGAGVTVTNDGLTKTINIPGGGGSGGLPTYSQPASVRTDIGNGTLSDGDKFYLGGELFEVQRSLDNDPDSWFYNTNGDTNYGVKPISPLPYNYYVFPGFKTQDNNKIHISISPDGRRFFRLNAEPIMRGGGDSTIGGRDSQLFWNENLGEWWMPVTSGSEVTDWDFSVFRSRDGITFGLSRGYLDANSPEGKVRGKTLPGAEQPVERQWSNKFYRFNGTLYIITSLQVLTDRVNAFGNTGPAFRPYIAEVIDEDNMLFGPVTQLQIGGATDPKLNPDFILVDGTYYACIKDSPTRSIEVWSASDLFGTWTLEDTIDINPSDFNSLEGDTWAVHKYVDPNDPDNILIKYRIHLANNRDENDKLIGIPRFTESLTAPAGPYGAIEQLDFSHASRNGTITNLAMVNDPRAIKSIMAAQDAYVGQFRHKVDEQETLNAGTHDLYPQQSFMYTIAGASGSTVVEVKEKVADRFYVGVNNTNAGAIIEFTGNNLCRPFTVGGGAQEYIEVIWNESIGKYVPIGRMQSFGVADKQPLTAATDTVTPTQDTEYYILGTAGSTQVTIPEKGADSFYVAVHNSDPGATVEFIGNDFCRPFTVGGGQQELIQVIWSEQIGKYIPVGRLSSGSGSSDGVVNSVAFDANERELTLGRTVGANLTATIPSENEPLVILVAGQSNAVGSLQATDGDKSVWPGTLAWDGTTTSNGTSFSTYEFGTYPLNRGTSPNFANNLGLQAANLLKQATGRDVYVIQLAEGGRRIEPFIQPATRTANGWTNLGGADIAPFFYDQIATALAAIPGRTTMVVDQFIWQQGENNQTDTQAEYQAKLEALHGDLVAAGVLSTTHGSFTIGGLVPDHPFYSTHRAAAEAAAGNLANTKYVNSVYLADVGDNVHFTGDALDGLSSRHICQGNQLSGLFAQPFSKVSGQDNFLLADNGFRVASRLRSGQFAPYLADQPTNLLGTGNNPWKGLSLALQDTSGDNTGTPLRLFLGDDGTLRLGRVGQNGDNNIGQDVTNRLRFFPNTQTSGTITWDRDNGGAVNNANAGLTGLLTFDASSLVAGEMCVLRVGSPNSQLLQITPPSGTTIDWAQGAPLTATTNRLQSTANTCMITLLRIGANNVMGIYTEFGATA